MHYNVDNMSSYSFFVTVDTICIINFYTVPTKMGYISLYPPYSLFTYLNYSLPGKQLCWVGDCVSVWGLGRWWCS